MSDLLTYSNMHPHSMQMQTKNKTAEWVERRPSVQNIGTHNPTMEATEVLLRLSMITLSLLLGSSSQLM